MVITQDDGQSAAKPVHENNRKVQRLNGYGLKVNITWCLRYSPWYIEIYTLLVGKESQPNINGFQK